MKFRPCIDIHDGKIKQIVGGSLNGGEVSENFVSQKGGDYFAGLYKSRGLTGGHIILLNPRGSEEYEADKIQAFGALAAFPGGLQVGGGITPDNAEEFLEAGASHVIVTSFVFRDGKVCEKSLRDMVSAVGRERLVLDLSCKRVGGDYLIATDRWSKLTDVKLGRQTLCEFSRFCDELLVHAVDVEGKREGIDGALATVLRQSPIVCTYAGGIRSEEDIERLGELGGGRIDFTVGSALDIFGGQLSFDFVSSKYAK